MVLLALDVWSCLPPILCFSSITPWRGIVLFTLETSPFAYGVKSCPLSKTCSLLASVEFWPLSRWLKLKLWLITPIWPAWYIGFFAISFCVPGLALSWIFWPATSSFEEEAGVLLFNSFATLDVFITEKVNVLLVMPKVCAGSSIWFAPWELYENPSPGFLMGSLLTFVRSKVSVDLTFVESTFGRAFKELFEARPKSRCEILSLCFKRASAIAFAQMFFTVGCLASCIETNLVPSSPRRSMTFSISSGSWAFTDPCIELSSLPSDDCVLLKAFWLFSVSLSFEIFLSLLIRVVPVLMLGNELETAIFPTKVELLAGIFPQLWFFVKFCPLSAELSILFVALVILYGAFPDELCPLASWLNKYETLASGSFSNCSLTGRTFLCKFCFSEKGSFWDKLAFSSCISLFPRVIGPRRISPPESSFSTWKP